MSDIKIGIRMPGQEISSRVELSQIRIGERADGIKIAAYIDMPVAWSIAMAETVPWIGRNPGRAEELCARAGEMTSHPTAAKIEQRVAVARSRIETTIMVFMAGSIGNIYGMPVRQIFAYPTQPKC